MTGEEDSGLKKVSEKGNTEVGSVMPTWLKQASFGSGKRTNVTCKD